LIREPWELGEVLELILGPWELEEVLELREPWELKQGPWELEEVQELILPWEPQGPWEQEGVPLHYLWGLAVVQTMLEDITSNKSLKEPLAGPVLEFETNHEDHYYLGGAGGP
jgi:hypothetical protein